MGKKKILIKRPPKPIYIDSCEGKLAPIELLNSDQNSEWLLAYREIQNPKYQIGAKNYSKTIPKLPCREKPEIYIVQRQRTKSYKAVLSDIDDGFYYVEMSKGFRFSDLSPFIAGPIPGKGLNVLNATWSEMICLDHLNGGVFCLNSPNLWKRGNKKLIKVNQFGEFMINGKSTNYDGLVQWLRENWSKWYPEWEKWSNHLKLSGEPGYKWLNKSDTVAWYHRDTDQFMKYHEHKSVTYGKYLKDYWSQSDTYQFVLNLIKKYGFTIVIVHPIVTNHDQMQPVTLETIKYREQNDIIMNAPFVLASKLLDDLVKI
jgi:hypothetical protein